MNSFRKIMNMKPMLAIFVALALSFTGATGITPALAGATTFVENVTFTLDQDLFVPCAMGGVGEIIHFSGNMHNLLIVTTDGSNGFHITNINNSQGLSGVGLTTGDNYQISVGGQDHLFIGNGVSPATFQTSLRVTGPGTGNNFLLHSNGHVTINANGIEVSFVQNTIVECR